MPLAPVVAPLSRSRTGELYQGKRFVGGVGCIVMAAMCVGLPAVAQEPPEPHAQDSAPNPDDVLASETSPDPDPPSPAPRHLHQTENGFARGERELGQDASGIPCDAFIDGERVDVSADAVEALIERARACGVLRLSLGESPLLVLAGEPDAVAVVRRGAVRVYHAGAVAQSKQSDGEPDPLAEFAAHHSVALLFDAAPRFDARLRFPGAVWFYPPRDRVSSSLDPDTRALLEHVERDGPMRPVDGVPPGAELLARSFGAADYVTTVTSRYPRWADLGLIACRNSEGQPVAISVVRGEDPRQRATVENRARAALAQMIHGVSQRSRGNALVTTTRGTVRGARVVKTFVRPDGFFALAVLVRLPPERAHLAQRACELSEEPRTYRFIRKTTLYQRQGFP